MNKYTRLTAECLEARKAKNTLAINLFNTLKGEVDTTLKGSDLLSEDVVESTAKKFKKNLESIGTPESEEEIALLEPYLPSQMEESEIIAELNLLNLKEMSTFGQKMGTAMKVLKGKADGRILGEIIRKNF